MVTVALDLLGGDDAPAAVVDGALLAVTEQSDLAITLVGPTDVAHALLAERGAADRFTVAAASEVVSMDEDPARAVRAKRDATVRVAARLVRDGAADAAVSVGSTGAAMAAAVFTLGRLRGLTRPALAVVVPAVAGPVVLLDAGAGVEASPDLLAQHALVGSAYAHSRLGLAEPRVGLLSVGAEPGKGDQVRKDAYRLIEALPLHFVGNVEGHDVPLGGRADVVVTDGFTGNVLLKGMEGAHRLASGGGSTSDQVGGAMLLGVDGVVVIGHGAAGARAVASCITLAAQAVREQLVPRIGEALASLVALRRGAVGVAR